MSQGDTRTDNARLLKALAVETEQAPDWIQAGRRVHSPHHGAGTITHLLGKRVFVEFGEQSDSPRKISYPSWQHILDTGGLKSISEIDPEAQSSITSPKVGSWQNEQSQAFLGDQLVEGLAKIAHSTFQELALELADKIQAVETVPAASGTQHPLPAALHPALKEALVRLGYTTLYSHQTEAFGALQAGQDVLLATPTASGKTLSYSLGVLNDCISNRNHSALYLFPLKALALDQMGKLQQIIEHLPPHQQIKAGLMSGDTSREDRQQMFSPGPPQILCLNPDLLHYHLYHVGNSLSRYETWREFLKHLKFVVVDEAHTYTAGFGAHLANLLRRLRLAVDRVGGNSNALQFIFSSATIGNPRELALKFSGRENLPQRLHLITQSGAASPERTLLCLQPSSSPNLDAAGIVISWLQKNLSGIVFLNTRAAAKKLLALIQEKLKQGSQGNLEQKVIVFHGSLANERRRAIIDSLRTGEVQVILSTSALEAGIDIPGLDCCLIRGYPGSVMSFHQRKGRAGRRDAGLVVFLPVAQNPLDYYFGCRPNELLHGPVESAMFNADYPTVLAGHLQCACCESGLASEEVEGRFGPQAGAIASELLDQGRIRLHEDTGWLWAPGRPHGEINMRGSAPDTFKLIHRETGEQFEEMSREIAYREVYPGAIYAAQGGDGRITTFQCEELDLSSRSVGLRPFVNENQFTQALTDLKVRLLDRLREPAVLDTTVQGGRVRLTWGWGEISESVDGYQLLSKTYALTCTNTRCSSYRKRLSVKVCPHCKRGSTPQEVIEVLAEKRFEVPYCTKFEAPVLRFEINQTLQQAIKAEVKRIKEKFDIRPHREVAQELKPLLDASPEFLAVHSAAHQICLAAPLVVIGAPQDINCIVDHEIERKETLDTVCYFYDTYAGGNGLTEAIFSRFSEFAARAKSMAESCECEHGCPRCLTYHGCPQHNEGLLKEIGLFLLDAIGRSIQ
ncbi:ATP-dependent helicase [uncultured Leptolyngbya sp.]|uniref:ATP-dependent helicase n=1 Tax=uncultured Leptolyngbya sp. TaxID=332963 RepID=A0A6J4P662_9CYAN|nr:ATP-dependent helicase [uncultured Leptolyngbya sp.]